MSISGALNNAMSGLRAAGKASQIVSANISNAMTPGYGKRSLILSANAVGQGGVRIDGITRHVDSGLAADRRIALAEQTNAETLTGFHQKLEGLLGTPNDPYSISGSLSNFENALITAASRPDAGERLNNVINAAKDLMTGLRNASDGVQDARTRADRTIVGQIDQLNNALQQVQALNSQITAAQVQGGDVASLQDFRQQAVDTISELVPVRQVPRDNGQIALYSYGGAILIDGRAAEIEFNAVSQVTPYMIESEGNLSGVTINGIDVRIGSEDGVFKGGAIAAQFEIRDELGVDAQSQLDAIARDLIERFENPAVDSTLAAGDPGLFTDQGAALNTTAERGLSSRLMLNSAVDPEQGGESWRIRDGVGAVTSGNVGESSLLLELRTALNETRVPLSGNFGTAATSAFDLTNNYTASTSAALSNEEQLLAYSSTRFAELNERQLADGVDTDEELRRLLIIEQSYGANVRILQAVDEMMQTILRL